MDPITRRLVETVRQITEQSEPGKPVDLNAAHKDRRAQDTGTHPVKEGFIGGLATGLNVLPKTVGRGIKGGIAGGAIGAGIGGKQGWEQQEPDSWWPTTAVQRTTNAISGAISGGIGGSGIGTGLGVASTFPNKLQTAKTALNLAQTAGDKISDVASAGAVKAAEQLPPVARVAGKVAGKATSAVTKSGSMLGKVGKRLGPIGALLGLASGADADALHNLHPLSILDSGSLGTDDIPAELIGQPIPYKTSEPKPKEQKPEDDYINTFVFGNKDTQRPINNPPLTPNPHGFIGGRQK